MRWRSCLFATMVLTASMGSSAAEGLVSVRSPLGVAQTMDRLVAVAEKSGMTIFARIDHAAGAEKVGLELRPTQVLVFGNPKGGTPLMQCAQTAGIDLPLKALVWQDAQGQVWVGYNDLAYLARRHDAGDCAVVGKLNQAIDRLIHDALEP